MNWPVSPCTKRNQLKCNMRESDDFLKNMSQTAVTDTKWENRWGRGREEGVRQRVRTWYTVGGQATPVFLLLFFSSLPLTHTCTHTRSFSDRLSSYSVGNARNFCVSIGKKIFSLLFVLDERFSFHQKRNRNVTFEYNCHNFTSMSVHTLLLPLPVNNLMDHITFGFALFHPKAELLARPLIIKSTNQTICLQPKQTIKPITKQPQIQAFIIKQTHVTVFLRKLARLHRLAFFTGRNRWLMSLNTCQCKGRKAGWFPVK